MRLLIVSHMPHHLRDGRVVGWGPTARELDRLATRFTTVRHVACLHPEPAPSSSIPYTAKNIELVPVPPSGADGVLGKLDVLRTSPHYTRVIKRELADANMVHVRAPAHIALMAMLILSARREPIPRWFKYAGNWKPDGAEPASYTFQRWWLRNNWHRGVVTVNGQWKGQEKWVRTFFNPSLDDDSLEHGRAVAAKKTLSSPLRMLYVGRVETPKGTGRAIEIVSALKERGVATTLEIIGDGDERAKFEQLARDRGVSDRIEFRGWQPPAVVFEALARAHVMLLPTRASEGWPKVLSEAMAFGAVPVAGAVSSIPQYIDQFRTGVALPADDIAGFAAAIQRYVDEPERWSDESKRAVAAAHYFTFSHYLSSVDQMLADLGLTASLAS